jgi:hypothetical protein
MGRESVGQSEGVILGLHFFLLYNYGTLRIPLIYDRCN